MADGKLSRIITASTSASRVEDGAELRTPQGLPPAWADGDMIVVKFDEADDAVLFAHPDLGPDRFDYKYKGAGYFGVTLERLPPDASGHNRLRIVFSEDHKDIQRMDDEAGR